MLSQLIKEIIEYLKNETEYEVNLYHGEFLNRENKIELSNRPKLLVELNSSIFDNSNDQDNVEINIYIVTATASKKARDEFDVLTTIINDELNKKLKNITFTSTLPLHIGIFKKYLDEVKEDKYTVVYKKTVYISIRTTF